METSRDVLLRSMCIAIGHLQLMILALTSETGEDKKKEIAGNASAAVDAMFDELERIRKEG